VFTREVLHVKAFLRLFYAEFGWVKWDVNRPSPVTTHLDISTSPSRFAYLLYNFPWNTMTIKGSTSLHVSTAIVKAFWSQNFPTRPSKIGQKFLFFLESGRIEIKILFSRPQKAHSRAERCHLTY